MARTYKRPISETQSDTAPTEKKAASTKQTTQVDQPPAKVVKTSKSEDNVHAKSDTTTKKTEVTATLTTPEATEEPSQGQEQKKKKKRNKKKKNQQAGATETTEIATEMTDNTKEDQNAEASKDITSKATAVQNEDKNKKIKTKQVQQYHPKITGGRWASDPSLSHYASPLSAPLIREAKEYFGTKLPDSAFIPQEQDKKEDKKDDKKNNKKNKSLRSFYVNLGDVDHWRTISKLAVRSYPLQTLREQLRERLATPIRIKLKGPHKRSRLSPEAIAEKDRELENAIQAEVEKFMKKHQNKSAVAIDHAIGHYLQLNTKEMDLTMRHQRGEEVFNPAIMGLFAPTTHKIVPDIELCPVHTPSVSVAIEQLQRIIEELQIVAFSDDTGAGSLRYALFSGSENPSPPGPLTLDSKLSPESQDIEGKVQLTLVWNFKGPDANKPRSFDTPLIPGPLPQGAGAIDYFKQHDPTLVSLLQELLKDDRASAQNTTQKVESQSEFNIPTSHWLWRSIHVHHQNAWSHTNSIFSFDPNSWQHIFGQQALTEVMPVVYSEKEAREVEAVKKQEAKNAIEASKKKAKKAEFKPLMPFPQPARPILYFPPNVFRQANIDGFSKIISSVRHWIPLGSRIIELYGGVGTIGLNLVDRAEYVVCSDENPNNAKCFLAATASLPPALRAGRAIKYISRGALGIVDLGALHRPVLTKSDIFPTVETLLKQQGLIDSDSDSDSDSEELSDDKNTAKKTKRAQDIENLIPKEDPTTLENLVLKLNTRGEYLKAPNVCIIDPPRKGLEPDVLKALSIPKAMASTPSTASSNAFGIEGLKKVSRVPTYKMPTQPLETSSLDRLIYVSCGFDALKRDLEQLISADGGGWKIAHAEGHVLFPGADHIETVVVLVR